MLSTDAVLFIFAGFVGSILFCAAEAAEEEGRKTLQTILGWCLNVCVFLWIVSVIASPFIILSIIWLT